MQLNRTLISSEIKEIIILLEKYSIAVLESQYV